MKEYKIAVLTYDVKHRKTYDTLCLLKAQGYSDVTVYAQPMTYIKKKQPLIKHRPDMIMDIPKPRLLCQNLDYEYVEGEFANTIGYSDDKDKIVYLLCGAGLLSEEFITSHRIINSHPGYIPFARGLDAYKWSIYYDLPVGVTTHILGTYIDAGEIIERRKIDVEEFDTFHSVSQRVYENEINMLISAIEKIDDKHELIIPEDGNSIFKRMSEDKEQEIFDRFKNYHGSIIRVIREY